MQLVRLQLMASTKDFETSTSAVTGQRSSSELRGQFPLLDLCGAVKRKVLAPFRVFNVAGRPKMLFKALPYLRQYSKSTWCRRHESNMLHEAYGASKVPYLISGVIGFF